MRAYSIFDDFPSEATHLLENAGIDVTVHPAGVPRPDSEQFVQLLDQYDCLIIGTSQKISENMFDNVVTPKLLATASSGTDHIHIPENKRDLITVVNAPNSNAISVAEYIFGAMFLSRKRYFEGNILYSQTKDNKKLIKKPEDVYGSTIGLVGAGRISTRVLQLLQPMGVKSLCHTKNPASHMDLVEKYSVEFVSLDELAHRSDIIAVNVPGNESTLNLINEDIIKRMKDTCVFISISRSNVVDVNALFRKANENENFYAVLDLDVVSEYAGMCNGRNFIITPHIAGGTIEGRNRLFMEATENIVKYSMKK